MSNLVTFEDLAKMKKEILGQSAPASIVKEVAASTKFRRMFNSDMSLGRALTGPQFVDTVSIQDGAVTAEKLIAELVLSTTIIAGVESPGDRIVIDGTGQHAYGTISGVPNTEYYSLDSDGWSVGVAPDRMTFDASTGTLTVPAAVITSLTIDNIGSGQLGGTYTSSATDTGTRLRLSTTGLEMYNGATRTVFLNAATGAFTLSNDPAGADRISVANTGIELWKGSTRQFYLQAGGATNAITMLLTGPGVSDYIGMNPTDGFWLGASSYAGASTKFRVSPAGVLQATSATISGAITATSGTLGSLSVTGALEISASGVFRSGPTSGARTEMDASGFYSYGSASAVRARLLATGAGALGISTSYTSGVINWTSAGALTIGGWTVTDTALTSTGGGGSVSISSGATAFSAGGGAFTVSAAGAVVASSLSAATLTITGAATFSGGSMALPNGGTITSSTIDINGNGVGAGTFSNMNFDGTTTIVSGGKITDADGSYWDQTGLVLKSAGAFGDSIRWQQGTTDMGSIYGTTSAMVVKGLPTNGATLELFPSEAILRYNGTNESLQLQSTNRRALFAGYVYPGTGSAAQTSRAIYDNGTATQIDGPYLRLTGSASAGNPLFYFNAAATTGSTSAWSTNGPGTANIAVVGTSYALINIGGTLYRIPFWANS